MEHVHAARQLHRPAAARSRYEPHYARGGTYHGAPVNGVWCVVVDHNDGSRSIVGDLTEYDTARLVTHLEEEGYRHVLG